MSAGRNAMTTNSEPRSPIPTQPTATGWKWITKK
jgi:hypothetical protein